MRRTPRRRLASLLVALFVLSSLVPTSAADFHIINGQPADEGEYPWMVSFVADLGGGQGFQCGATAVRTRWVLTAAHCVFADEAAQELLRPEQLRLTVDDTRFLRGTPLRAIRVVPHPAYQQGGNGNNNDLALVEVAEDIPVAPIPLAGLGNVDLNDPPTQGTVIGWGETEEGTTSEVLLEVDVPVVADADPACQRNGITPDLMVCAGLPSGDPEQPGQDSCVGDSGGPLLALVQDQPVQFGVVSFGEVDCATRDPGVYVQLSSYTDFIAETTGSEGPIPPTGGDPTPEPTDQPTDEPTPPGDDPVRIAIGDGDDPVTQAIAMSRVTWPTDGSAAFGVLAASARFPDALGGSALASYLGNLLYVDADGSLRPETLAELDRAVGPDRRVYVLGGTAVIGADVEVDLQAAGFDVVRLGGDGRQDTARLVAEEVRAAVNDDEAGEPGDPPFNQAIVAFEGNWPDAVAVGQISAFWGIPILLTPTGQLGGPAADYLRTHLPSEVLVIGGEAVVGPQVVAQVEAITGPDSVVRLGGDSRLDTSAEVTGYNVGTLFARAQDAGVDLEVVGALAVNLRRDDAFAHVLAAAQLAGRAGMVFAPLEAPDGSFLDQRVLDSVCGLGVRLYVAGGSGLVPDSVLGGLRAALAGEGCAAG